MSFLNYIRCISYCNKIHKKPQEVQLQIAYTMQFILLSFVNTWSHNSFAFPAGDLLDIIITFLVDAVICQVHALVPDVSVALLIFHCSKPVYQIKEGECICYFQVRQQIMAHKRNPGTQSIPQAHYKEIYDYKSQLI